MAKSERHGKSAISARIAPKKAAPLASRRVLLVDDDVDFLEIHRTALEAAGYEVGTAYNRAEALALTEQSNFDVAVLDVIMTTPNEGFELARDLRKGARTHSMRLLMLTSLNAVNEAKGLLFRFGDQDRDDLWLPVDRFVDKPLAPEALVRLVAELSG